MLFIIDFIFMKFEVFIEAFDQIEDLFGGGGHYSFEYIINRVVSEINCGMRISASGPVGLTARRDCGISETQT